MVPLRHKEFLLYISSERTNDQIEKAFTHHPPKNNQPDRYAELRAEGRALALLIVGNTPQSREQSLALTNLEQAIMWANAAIARNE